MSKTRKKDGHYLKAKKEGFLARSVYKLEEIEKKYPSEFKKIHKVLDLGCSPGSWAQFLTSKNKKVIGVDLVKPSFTHPNFEFIQSDINELDFNEFSKIDAVVSDMAPKTTGMRDLDSRRSIELAELGYKIFVELEANFFIAKVFESEFAHDFIKQLDEKTKIIRPKASQARSSREFYLVINKYS